VAKSRQWLFIKAFRKETATQRLKFHEGIFTIRALLLDKALANPTTIKYVERKKVFIHPKTKEIQVEKYS
jgi:hypothetical protein